MTRERGETIKDDGDSARAIRWTLPTGWPFGCAGHRLKREAHTSSAWAPRLPTAAIGLSHSGQHAKISVWGIFTGKRLGVHLYREPGLDLNRFGSVIHSEERS